MLSNSYNNKFEKYLDNEILVKKLLPNYPCQQMNCFGKTWDIFLGYFGK